VEEIKRIAMNNEELFEAAEKGDRSKVQVLLKMGIDVNSRDVIGQSALSRALFARHSGGDTALSIARKLEHTTMVSLFNQYLLV
jgi:ankyrin repeat protein